MSVTHNAALSRYEMKTDHGLAIAVYRQQGDSLIFTHTEVPPADEKGASRTLLHIATDWPSPRTTAPPRSATAP